jgi:hypothetical protein
MTNEARDVALAERERIRAILWGLPMLPLEAPDEQSQRRITHFVARVDEMILGIVPTVIDDWRQRAADLNARLATREANYVGDPSRTSDGFPKVVTNAPDPPPAGDMSLDSEQKKWAATDAAKRDAERKR